MGKHTIDWNNYPSIEECMDMGDKNGNVLDVELGGLEDKVILAEEENKENQNNLLTFV